MHGANPKNRGGNPRIKEHLEKRLNTPEALARRSERMKDNKLAVTHGAIASELLSDKEEEIYLVVKEILRDEYGLDFAADEILVHQLAWKCAKLYVAEKGVAASSTRAGIEGRISALLRQLNIRRDKRGETGKAQTPQELFAEVVKSIKVTQTTTTVEVESGQAPAGQLPAGKVIDVEEQPPQEKEPAKTK